MPETTAIPLGCFASAGTFYIGTGFLARHNGTTGLVTAAHTPTRSQPTSAWASWPAEMLLFLAHGQHITTSLFLYMGLTRAPSFRYLQAAPPRIADMMLLTGLVHQNVIAQLALRYPIVDLAQANVAPQPGEVLTCYGFPDHDLDRWPYTPPFSSSGPFLGVDGPMFQAQTQTEVGQSGGPVFDGSDRFVGMLIGSTNGVTNIVPTNTISALWH